MHTSFFPEYTLFQFCLGIHSLQWKWHKKWSSVHLFGPASKMFLRTGKFIWIRGEGGNYKRRVRQYSPFEFFDGLSGTSMPNWGIKVDEYGKTFCADILRNFGLVLKLLKMFSQNNKSQRKETMDDLATASLRKENLRSQSLKSFPKNKDKKLLRNSTSIKNLHLDNVMNDELRR